MSNKWIVVILFLGALAVPAFSLAHAGHTHKVLGTVTALTNTKMEVKTTDGKVVAITVDDKTAYVQGNRKVKVDAKALKVGDRVVVDVNGTDALSAETVQMAAAPTTARK